MNGSSVDERGKTHHGKSNLFQETPKPLCSTFLPTDVKHCLNVGYTFVNFTTSEAVWKSHVCITRKSWPLFKSKKIAQVVRAWIQSKNSLVKHFEDMRLCRPSKEYLQGKFVTLKTLEEKYRQKGDSQRLSVVQHQPSLLPLGKSPNVSLPLNSSYDHPSGYLLRNNLKPSPRPSPTPSPTPIVPDSIPEPTGENLGDHSSNDASLSGNEDDMTLQNVYDLCISLCQQVSDKAKEIKLLKAKIKKLKIKSFSKKQRVHKKYVSKQGRKKAKGESSVQRDPMFEVLAEDKIDHMETENAQTEGRTRDMVDEEKEFDEDRLSTEDEVSTVKEGVSTDFEKVSTDRPKVSTDESKVSTDEQVEGTEESNESTEEIFEGTEEQRESTEDKVSTDEQMEVRKGKGEIEEEEDLKVKMLIFLKLLKKFKQLRARNEATEFLAEKLQEQERRAFLYRERAKVPS
ncbi:MEI2-like protein 6 [Tanacetum coccineum]